MQEGEAWEQQQQQPIEDAAAGMPPLLHEAVGQMAPQDLAALLAAGEGLELAGSTSSEEAGDEQLIQGAALYEQEEADAEGMPPGAGSGADRSKVRPRRCLHMALLVVPLGQHKTLGLQHCCRCHVGFVCR